MSQAERGKQPPRTLPPEKLRDWDGVSVLETLEQARRFQTRFPYLGSYAAELHIPESVPLIITPADENGHFTIKAPGAVLIQYVVSITPL